MSDDKPIKEKVLFNILKVIKKEAPSLQIKLDSIEIVYKINLLYDEKEKVDCI